MNSLKHLIGSGSKMQSLITSIKLVAPTNTSVLLTGETGTGKEVVAQAIHDLSAQKNGPFIKVNCAALPTNLVESELFGHEKGSFTGAHDRRIGKFELANKGTILLDEISEMSLDIQVKILRALQEKEIERLGGITTIKTDIRIIAATNKDLAIEVKKGTFRSDLYYRLHVFPIVIPPLRDRKEDIAELVSYFLKQHSQKNKTNVTGLTKQALRKLESYQWPGNVRELEHVIERTMLLTSGNTIKEVILPDTEKTHILKSRSEKKIKTLDEVEREHIHMVLSKSNGRVRGKGGAAELLKIPPTTLHSKMKKLGIKKIMD